MNCIEKPSSMILGSTPEFVDLLISRNCLNIASIDNNKENHLSMLKLCNAQNKDKLSFVNSNWLNQGDEGKLSYDIIVGDISHYFLSFPDEWNTSFKIISGKLSHGGCFLSRQICQPDNYERETYLALLSDLKTKIATCRKDISRLLCYLSEYKSIIPVICTDSITSKLNIKNCIDMSLELETYTKELLDEKIFDQISPLFDPPPKLDGVSIYPKSVPKYSEMIEKFKIWFHVVESHWDTSLNPIISNCFDCGKIQPKYRISLSADINHNQRRTPRKFD